MISLYKYITNSNTYIICKDAELFYRIHLEFFYLSLILGFFITTIYNPEYIMNNFSLHWGGYNNFCVYIDTAPAKYFASPILTLSSYFGLRYCSLDYERIQKTDISNTTKFINWLINLLFSMSLSCLPLLLTMTPSIEQPIHAGLHTLIFIFYIFTNTLQFVFRYYIGFVKFKSEITYTNILYLVSYLFCTIGYISCFILLMYVRYQPNKYVFMFFDYSFFLMLLLSSFYIFDIDDDVVDFRSKEANEPTLCVGI